MIEIKNIRPEDMEALVHIQTEAWEIGFREILEPKEIERYTQPELVRQRYEDILAGCGYRGLLLTADGVPQCLAVWGASREEDLPAYAEVVCLLSLKSSWGKGRGTRMMEQLFEEMRAAGYGRVMLWVFEKNLRARRFYDKLGFSPTDRRKEFAGAVEMMYHREL